MGLDAFVNCRCLVDGLVSEPPFATGIDSEGYLSPVADLNGTEYQLWDKWCSAACEHEDMEAASERIANWGGYRMFQGALESLGIENFPTLAAELPNANGGLCKPAESRLCLHELARFAEMQLRQTTVQLCDVRTGSLINERVDAYDGVIVLNGSDGTRFALTAHGTLRIFDAETDDTIFEATRFDQQVIDLEEERPLATLTSENGTTAIVAAIANHGTPGGDSLDYPASLEVRTSELDMDRFSRIITALRSVFLASIENDMPVMWT